MNENEIKYDYEPDSIADALNWLKKMDEEVHSVPLSDDEIKAEITAIEAE